MIKNKKSFCIRNSLESAFAKKNFSIYPYQKEAWQSIASGKNTFIESATGFGKTYAAIGGVLLYLEKQLQPEPFVIILSPLKALCVDLANNIKDFLKTAKIDLSVAVKTGETRLKTKNTGLEKETIFPHFLITTPESFAVLLTDPQNATRLKSCQALIIDEWHDLDRSKRGRLLELHLAQIYRLGADRPPLIVGLSATVTPSSIQRLFLASPFRVIKNPLKRSLDVEVNLPSPFSKLPPCGHLGLRTIPQVCRKLSDGKPTLIFVNTRSQAERWYQALYDLLPVWRESLALHHGSLDGRDRKKVEQDIKSGRLRFVVATSSLELGVDLPFIDRVIQIGSPKSLDRLVQRGGRSARNADKTASLILVPTFQLEAIEAQTFCEIVGNSGSSSPLSEADKEQPLSFDVLCQFLVGRAIFSPFDQKEILKEIQLAPSFRNLDCEHLDRILLFLTTGGAALAQYPQYQKLMITADGFFQAASESVKKRHRLSIGTIVSAATIELRTGRGKSFGQIEEGFLQQLIPGDVFLFAGKQLKLEGMKNGVAYVKPVKSPATKTPRWWGGQLRLDSSLAWCVRKQLLNDSATKVPFVNEFRSQLSKRSHLPKDDEILVEIFKSDKLFFAFFYPFLGQINNQTLAMLTAYRLSQERPISLVTMINDYGFALASETNFIGSIGQHDWQEIWSAGFSKEDSNAVLTLSEYARMQFQKTAKISGLLQSSMPHARGSSSEKQLRVSAGLLYDVLSRFDPGHFLIQQAREEALFQIAMKFSQEDTSRLGTLKKVRIVGLNRLSGLSFPLFADFIKTRLSTESIADQITAYWQKNIDDEVDHKTP